MKTCKEPGCCRIVQARGMCNSHYKQWARSNPGLEMRRDAMILRTVEDCLPATLAQILDESGMCHPTVKKSLERLYEEGRAFIGDFEPPTTPGTRFQPIWIKGAGVHAVLTKEMRREQRRKADRDAYHQRNMIKRARAARSLGWASVLAIAA